MAKHNPISASRALIALLCLSISSLGHTQQSAFCGDTGVWIQILGAGGPELTDGMTSASYVVWLDDKARLLVDAAPGSAAHFDASGASFEDLDAIVFTQLHADHAADFPSFVEGSRYASRERPLAVLGPDGNEQYPDTQTLVERLIGRQGAFPQLAHLLTYRSSDGYKINVRNVPSTGRRRWSRFGTENIRLAAMPVHHGTTPAIAWRVEVAGQVIVFTGDFSNQKNVIYSFAENADALVVSHAIPETARGELRERYALPSQLGQIANQANARMLILGHRMSRTRGRETQSRKAIEEHYNGALVFANDLECWGL
tara:strand:+ start:23130 stop:24071 length:942 start_codon:yes stop_codon:yes gene_type:complete